MNIRVNLGFFGFFFYDFKVRNILIWKKLRIYWFIFIELDGRNGWNWCNNKYFLFIGGILKIVIVCFCWC